MDSNNLSNIINSLESLVNKSKENDPSYLFSESNAFSVINDTHYQIKKELEVLFGEEQDPKNFGELQSLFNAKNSPGVYDKAVLFSYWSYHQVPHSFVERKDGKWRGNLFYKGNRFSYPEKKRQFYKLLKVARPFVKDNVPVDFFARIGCQNNNKCVSHSINRISISSIKQNEVTEYSLRIPIISDFNTNNSYSDSTKKLFGGISVAKTKMKDASFIDEQIEDVVSDLKEIFEEEYDNAREEFIKFYQSELRDLKDSISLIFKSVSFNNDESDNGQLFDLIVAYQFYDHDGLIVLYFPTCQTENEKCCLGFIIPQSKYSELVDKDNVLINVLNQLSRLTNLEKEIWESVANNIHTKLVWKNHYSNALINYEKLKYHIEVLLKAICQREKIKYQSIDGRLKDFDSFYSRVIDRYNAPEYYHIKSDEDKIKYRQAVLNPFSENAEFVFSRFWDIVGLRILCTFRDDIDKLKKVFTLGNKADDYDNPYPNESLGIKLTFREFYKEGDYKAEHYIISLAENRLALYEFKDLKNLKCEVQVKTILTQGWSDVDHDLFYKTKLPKSLLDEFFQDKNDVHKDRRNTSESLEEIDKKFLKLKKIIEISKND